MIAKLRSKYEICCENYNGVLSTLWNQILVIFCNNLEFGALKGKDFETLF